MTHSQTLNIAAQAAYPAQPQVAVPFVPTSVTFSQPADPAQRQRMPWALVVSLDGTQDTLLVQSVNLPLTLKGANQNLWLRKFPGMAVGAVNVTVAATDEV